MNRDDESISSTYHSAGKPEPSDALDDAILAASRDAVDKPVRATGPFTGGWPAAASIAAVIVITVILVPLLRQEQPQQAEPQPARKQNAPAELTEKAAPGVLRSREVKKTTLDAPAPASRPAMSPQQERVSEEQAMPVQTGVGSNAAGLIRTGDNSFPEKEEDAEAVGDLKRSVMEAADSAPFAVHTPEMWEVKIEQLIVEGKLDHAKAELEKLQQHYPDHTVSPNILNKLE